MASSESFFKEGAYGCVFRPGMDCLGKKENSKYITKIQLNEETSENEINIGKFIETVIKKDIPFYEDMFAPIISSCIVDLGKIQNETIKKCEIIQKNNDATKIFVSNKIRYVGKYTLEPFLKFYLNSNQFYIHFFQSHLYLLNSLNILSNYNIIHFDLKQNNISVDDSKKIPVIIDFGLSFRLDNLITDLDYEKYFYVYYDKYPPWCLEIAMISFIVQEFKNIQEFQEGGRLGKKREIVKKKKRVWKNSIIEINHLIDIVEHFFHNNYAILQIKQPSSISKAKKDWISFIKKELHKKTGEYIVRFLMKSWKTWDNYALSVIYLSLFSSFALSSSSSSSSSIIITIFFFVFIIIITIFFFISFISYFSFIFFVIIVPPCLPLANIVLLFAQVFEKIFD